ncbi:MAG: hypothetical protein CMP10_10795 [Zetaproteobacteria bacterium]|nr:hypothetical protein [Pseudobdellovibrionaceae bacterium]|tara:strand:- start:245 stop:556 length:312 start_codon:yes stop_codon:yes gene_type:complete
MNDDERLGEFLRRHAGVPKSAPADELAKIYARGHRSDERPKTWLLAVVVTLAAASLVFQLIPRADFTESDFYPEVWLMEYEEENFEDDPVGSWLQLADSIVDC